MTLRLSTALRDYINADGSFKGALQGGELKIYSGSQPANADAAPTGTLLCTITKNGGARTPEVQATGSVTLASGAGGQVSGITVGGVEIMGKAVAYNTSLSQTAALVAAQINRNRSIPDYKATASGNAITIIAPRGMGAGANALVVTSTVTTMSANDVSMSGGVSAVNGLGFDVSTGGVLVKDDTDAWSGVAVATGTAGWYRFTGSVADSGALDSSASQVRLDGAISTSGAQLNMSSTSITSGATQTVSSFPVTLPTA